MPPQSFITNQTRTKIGTRCVISYVLLLDRVLLANVPTDLTIIWCHWQNGLQYKLLDSNLGHFNCL